MAQQSTEFLAWESEPDVSGEAAMIAAGPRALDLLVSPVPEGFEWEVIEGVVRIALGYAPTVAQARRAAESAARRALWTVIT